MPLTKDQWAKLRLRAANCSGISEEFWNDVFVPIIRSMEIHPTISRGTVNAFTVLGQGTFLEINPRQAVVPVAREPFTPYIGPSATSPGELVWYVEPGLIMTPSGSSGAPLNSDGYESATVIDPSIWDEAAEDLMSATPEGDQVEEDTHYFYIELTTSQEGGSVPLVDDDSPTNTTTLYGYQYDVTAATVLRNTDGTPGDTKTKRYIQLAQVTYDEETGLTFDERNWWGNISMGLGRTTTSASAAT